jgi:hypothetical protein
MKLGGGSGAIVAGGTRAAGAGDRGDDACCRIDTAQTGIVEVGDEDVTSRVDGYVGWIV